MTEFPLLRLQTGWPMKKWMLCGLILVGLAACGGQESKAFRNAASVERLDGSTITLDFLPEFRAEHL